MTDLQNITANLNAHDVLVDDIDAASTPEWHEETDHFEGFVPVGPSGSPFNVTLEGNGYMIKNLFLNRSSGDNIGLFGSTGTSCSITIVI